MEFQPFSVTCVTCASRLRVSRQDLVGSIVTCPKCQSMVQLTPQPSATADDAPIALGKNWVDSGALTEDSISTPDLPGAENSGPESHSDEPTGGFREPPPVFNGDPAAESDSGDDALEDESALPPDWHSKKSAKSRKIAMTIAVVLASIVSAVILFSVMNRNRKGDVAQQQNLPAEDQPTKTSDDSEATAGSNDDSEPAESTEPDTTPPPSDTEAEPVSDASADVPEPAEMASDVPDSPSPIPGTLLPDNPLLPTNPLDGLPGLDGPGTNQNEDPQADTSKLTQLPDGLKGIFDTLNQSRPQFTETSEAPETIDEIQLDRAADADVNLEVVMDKPDPIRMRQALGLSIAMQSANAEGYPFNDLMLLLSQLSGVPIEVEWVSFEVVGMPINQRVKLPSSWLTIEDILKAVCDANGAEFETRERSISIRPTDERFEQAVADVLDLSDISDDTESAVTITRTLLGQTNGAPDQVFVPLEKGPKQLAVMVCESIRRVRGVKGKVSDSILSRWAGIYSEQASGWPELVDGVSGPLRVQPTSFVSIVRQIAQSNGATCFVNWPDGAKRNLMPTEKLMPHTGDTVSAASAMSQILTPANLQVRVVDKDHWWIGSSSSFDRFPVVVWFDKETDAEQTRTKVQAILDGATNQGNSLGAVAVDPKTQTCVSVMPRYLLRQMPRLLKQNP